MGGGGNTPEPSKAIDIRCPCEFDVTVPITEDLPIGESDLRDVNHDGHKLEMIQEVYQALSKALLRSHCGQWRESKGCQKRRNETHPEQMDAKG